MKKLLIAIIAASTIGCANRTEDAMIPLGKWYDGPRVLAIWFVCERPNDDGCHDEGWSSFGKSCYAISDTLKPYDEAASACEAKGAQLVSIQSSEENAHVQGLCDRRACWIGLSEPPDSENWFWPDGAAGKEGEWIGYTNWNAGEPNNWNGIDEDAAFMNYWEHLDMPFPRSPNHVQKHLGKWHDAPRDLAIWYVCERSDKDGCREEGWSAFGKSCYAFSDNRKTYADAASACEAMGAQLVSIESAEENAYVQELCDRRACWIGLSEPPDSENWFWPDGTTGGKKGEWSGYTNWDEGQPDNWRGIDEDAAYMNFWGYLGMPEPWSTK